ncbi:MAG: endonuclease/exonuclease/phosphatase family protein [Pseudomonadota bacterium]
MSEASRLSCATWNIHRARGTDGRVDPGRIVDAIGGHLAPLNLDILALQEADEECRPHAQLVDVSAIAKELGLGYCHDTPELRWGPDSSGFLGTILFVHPRFDRQHADVIDLPGHCHRGAVSVEVSDSDDRSFRILSAHLSLAQPLRVIQMRIIGQYLRRRPPMQTLFLGDLNEWRPWGGLMFSRRLVGTDFKGPARATFPSQKPFLPLDRIMTDRPNALSEVRAMQNKAFVAASDHLPLTACVTLV